MIHLFPQYFKYLFSFVSLRVTLVFEMKLRVLLWTASHRHNSVIVHFGRCDTGRRTIYYIKEVLERQQFCLLFFEKRFSWNDNSSLVLMDSLKVDICCMWAATRCADDETLRSTLALCVEKKGKEDFFYSHHGDIYRHHWNMLKPCTVTVQFQV